jgi:hypothetical protein
MSKIKVVAGDLDHGTWDFNGMFGSALMTRASTKAHIWKGETYSFSTDIENVELLDEEKVKKLTGTAGWGVAGAVLLGPLGAIGGILLGGNKKEVAFAAYMKDGKKFMATTDSKAWKKIMAAKF